MECLLELGEGLPALASPWHLCRLQSDQKSGPFSIQVHSFLGDTDQEPLLRCVWLSQLGGWILTKVRLGHVSSVEEACGCLAASQGFTSEALLG